MELGKECQQCGAQPGRSQAVHACYLDARPACPERPASAESIWRALLFFNVPLELWCARPACAAKGTLS